MTDSQVLQIARDAFAISIKVGGPILIAALIIGVFISVLQTITQIQEMTLTFVPKLLGTGLVVLFAGRWMMSEIVGWVQSLWAVIPSL